MSKCCSSSSWYSHLFVTEYQSKLLNNFIFIKYISISHTMLIMLSVVFYLMFSNIAFFSNVIEAYPLGIKNSVFLVSLVMVLVCVNILLLCVLCFRHTIKPVLILIFLGSAAASYYMDNYNVIIDEAMIQSIVKTDSAEIFDLLTFKLLVYLLLLGGLPSVLILKIKLHYSGFYKELLSRFKIFSLAMSILILTIFMLGDYYASFFREHALIRSYSNPTTFMYSSFKYLSQSVTAFVATEAVAIKRIGLDAELNYYNDKPKLIIFVVGETARADRFSLNGYPRDTNTFLKNERLINFTNFWSCATSTAISVPCMFSIYTQDEYQQQKGDATENVLDILYHAGVEVLWLDNNSDSKGVAKRVPYQSFKSPKINPICDIECRDEGMLSNLQDFIDDNEYQNIFIVLHQMGNHGPAYYKRYPKNFERFTPSCNTNQLESCSNSEISNAYDNAIAYTDYFLSRVITLLKNNSRSFESTMFYVSDHGESLGENGLYLHGMPNIFAPDVQRHVPAIMWSSDSNIMKNYNGSKINNNIKLSHDNIFHTVLGMMEVNTSVYVKSLDIISILRQSQ